MVEINRFAIFGPHSNLLQWIGFSQSADAAVQSFHKQIGIVEEDNTDLLVATVSDQQVAQLRIWQELGSNAMDFPVGIIRERIGASHIARLLGFASAKKSEVTEIIDDCLFVFEDGAEYVNDQLTWPDMMRLKIPRNQAREFAMDILRSLLNTKPGEAVFIEKPMVGKFIRS